MRVLKESGSYLQEQAKSNRNRAFIIFIIAGGILLYSSFTVGFGFSIYLFIIIFGIGLPFLKSYANYTGGSQAEKLIAQSLQNLNDNYFLINDMKLPESRGNIDHIVLGQNGIFVIETKNYSGKIICNGDEWIRHYESGLGISMGRNVYFKPDRNYSIGSPSRQVKRNAVKVKQIIDSSKIFKKPFRLWVEGIVVFTNPNVELQLSKATVPILKVDDLYNYIKGKKSGITFSSQELESIGNAILGRMD